MLGFQAAPDSAQPRRLQPIKAEKSYTVFIYSQEVQRDLHKRKGQSCVEIMKREFSFYAVVTWGINSWLTEVTRQSLSFKQAEKTLGEQGRGSRAKEEQRRVG